MTEPRLVPRLAVADPQAAARLLTGTFGFQAETPHRLHLGAQVIELCPGDGAKAHGVIDHLALAVADVDASLKAHLARGAEPDRSVTPDGPLFIPEFWTAGVRYVFLQGPEGARIELCARPGIQRPGLPGPDHIGLACRDLPAMQAFFLSLGFTPLAATTLIRDTGDVPVAFLGLGTSVVELYTPPGQPSAPPPQGHWNSLILEGTGRTGPVTGPEAIAIDQRA